MDFISPFADQILQIWISVYWVHYMKNTAAVNIFLSSGVALYFNLYWISYALLHIFFMADLSLMFSFCFQLWVASFFFFFLFFLLSVCYTYCSVSYVQWYCFIRHGRVYAAFAVIKSFFPLILVVYAF